MSDKYIVQVTWKDGDISTGSYRNFEQVLEAIAAVKEHIAEQPAEIQLELDSITVHKDGKLITTI